MNKVYNVCYHCVFGLVSTGATDYNTAGVIQMLKMEESSRRFLERYLPAALEVSKLNDALEMLYDLIDEKGFAPPHYYDYNDFGREAQRVYDDLF